MKFGWKDTIKDVWRVARIVGLVCIPVAMLMFHVWTQFQITSLGYEVAEQTREHRELIEQNRKLSIEATYQGRTERVLSVAQEQFGLQPMQPEQVVPVDIQRASGDDESTQSSEHAALQVRD
ncbi:MAG: cell division protein FtsL [Myxococcota bacterium]